MLYCRQCSSTASPEHHYCGTCGRKLEWGLSGTRKKISFIAFLLAVLSWAYLLFRTEEIPNFLGGRYPLLSLRFFFLITPFLLILLTLILSKKMPHLFARSTRIEAIVYLALAGSVFTASANYMRGLVDSELVDLQLHPPGTYFRFEPTEAQRERGPLPGTEPTDPHRPPPPPSTLPQGAQKKGGLPPTTIAPHVDQEAKREQSQMVEIVDTKRQWLLEKYSLYLSSIIYLMSVGGIVLSYILEKRKDFTATPTSVETTELIG